MTAPGIHETKLAREQRWQAFMRAAQDGDNVASRRSGGKRRARDPDFHHDPAGCADRANDDDRSRDSRRHVDRGGGSAAVSQARRRRHGARLAIRLGARLERARDPVWPAAFALADSRSDPHRKRSGSALVTCSYE